MEIYLPTLEEKMVALGIVFRFIVFAIMVGGLVLYGSSQPSGVGIVKILAKALIIVAAVATMDQWFPKVERTMIDVAEFIDPGYEDNPTSSADAIRESTTSNPEGQEWSWRRLNESIYQAVSNALANIFIYIGTLITVPMLILQYVQLLRLLETEERRNGKGATAVEHDDSLFYPVGADDEIRLEDREADSTAGDKKPHTRRKCIVCEKARG
jgi:hypothetical protein